MSQLLNSVKMGFDFVLKVQTIPLIGAIFVAIIVTIIEGIVEDTTMRALFPIILDMADLVEQYEYTYAHIVANIIRAIPPLVSAIVTFVGLGDFSVHPE